MAEPADTNEPGLVLLSQAMTPHLPMPEDEVMPAQGGSFDDRVLLLLSALGQAGGVLTYPEYELTAEIVREVFGEKALLADVQARFHYALLRPPASLREVENIALTLAREAVEEQVAASQVVALLAGLDTLSGRENAGDLVRQLREAVDIAFAEQKLTRRRESLGRAGAFGSSLEKGLEAGARLSVQVGKAAVGGTMHLLDSVLGAAHKILPSSRGPEERGEEFTPAIAEYNRDLVRWADTLGRAAWTLDLPQLQAGLKEFRILLADQPFRLVLVGEGKRGKSSLVNAMLGEALSPVRESVPETATVAEFFYAPQAEYNVRFLDEERYAHLEEYLAGEEDNLLLRKKSDALKEWGGEERPRGLAHLTSRADIPDYLGADGRYSSLVSKVSIGLPLEILSGGMVLVDTPGLNATDSFHDYLAYEESLSADCLVVLLDARRPDSASELRLLRKLAATGRAVNIIGIVTGIDRLNSTASVDNAVERAHSILREACRGAESLTILGVVPLDARQAMEQRCYPGIAHHSGRTEKDFQALLELVRSALASDAGKVAYRRRISARLAALAQTAREQSRLAFEEYRSSLPPAQFLELLGRHGDQLATAAVSLGEQARSVIAAAAHEIDEWRMEQERALDVWEELLVRRVMDAARDRADVLGTDFAKENAWKEFDGQEVPLIARRSLDEFLSQQQEKLYAWNEKLRLFHEEIRELSVLCLRAVEESAGELGDICRISGNIDHILVKSNAHMRRLAVFLAGAGAGGLLAGSLLNIVALGSAAFVLLTNPLVLPGAALVGAAAYALQSLGNMEKRKAAFLQKKRKKTEQWAKEVRGVLAAELQAAREELAVAYRNAVSRGFVPALEILTGEAVHLRLYLEVMDKIRDDTDRFEEALTTMLDDVPHDN